MSSENEHTPAPPWQLREDGRGWLAGKVKTVGTSPRLDAAEALQWNAARLQLSPLCGRWFPRRVFKCKMWEE